MCSRKRFAHLRETRGRRSCTVWASQRDGPPLLAHGSTGTSALHPPNQRWCRCRAVPSVMPHRRTTPQAAVWVPTGHRFVHLSQRGSGRAPVFLRSTTVEHIWATMSNFLPLYIFVRLGMFTAPDLLTFLHFGPAVPHQKKWRRGTISRASSAISHVSLSSGRHISWSTMTPSSGSLPLLQISLPTAHQVFYLTDGEVAGASPFGRKFHLISTGNDPVLENGRNALILRRSPTV